jgi:TrmH family RNA methyltransferase
MNGIAHALEDVRRAATAKGRAQLGAFAAEGLRLLQRGLRAGWQPRRVLVAESLGESEPELAALLAGLRAGGTECLTLPDAPLLELSERRRSGLCSSLFELPRAASLPEWLRALPERSVVLCLVEVDEPGNVGALLRTALASAVAGVVCVGHTDAFHPKAVRTSLGSLFKLPLVRSDSAAHLLSELGRHGVYSLATVARGGEPLPKAHWPDQSLALLMGNEGQGLSESVANAADARIRIDLSLEVDSYSVNAAAAVCLYEIQRRRIANMAGSEP